jgi:hypothetical protein
MNTLKVMYWNDIPECYTGIVEHPDGIKVWYLLNGRLHREDGPAIEYMDGEKHWYLNGINYSQEEWFEKLSAEDKLEAIWNLR